MSGREELLALAERVEGLDVPSFTVEMEIARAINPNATRLTVPNNYTASLDAALSLVPTDSWHEIKGPRKYLNIPTPSPNYWSAHLARWNHEFQVAGWGSTPALALTAAALRALAEQQP